MASVRQKKKSAAISAVRQQEKQLQRAREEARREKEAARREAGRAYASRLEAERKAKREAAARGTRATHYKKDKAKEQRIHRENTKYQALKMIGYSDTEARKLSRGRGALSFPAIEQLALKKSRKRKNVKPSDKVYTAGQFLTVVWISFSGNANFMSGHDIITSWNRDDKRVQAAQTYANSSETDDDSSGARGDFLHMIAPKEVGELFIARRAASVNRKNRSALSSGDDFNKQYEVVLAPTNKFTVNGMLDLMNTVMAKVVPYRARDFYSLMHDYTKEYLPKAFYDEIF